MWLFQAKAVFISIYEENKRIAGTWEHNSYNSGYFSVG